MKRFIVETIAVQEVEATVWYAVDAESKEEAKDLVMSGQGEYYNDIPGEFGEFEPQDIISIDEQ